MEPPDSEHGKQSMIQTTRIDCGGSNGVFGSVLSRVVSRSSVILRHSVKEITRILKSCSKNEPRVADESLPLVYEELEEFSPPK